MTLGEARRGFDAISEETTSFGDGLVALADVPAAPLPAPRLLGGFDPILHGWASREPFVGAHAGVVTTNGIFRRSRSSPVGSSPPGASPAAS